MRIKPNLKQVLLSFFESHKRVEVKAVLDQFNPDGTQEELHSIMELLQAEGWIEIKKSYGHDGYTIKRPVIVRTSKNMYAQPKLSEIF